MKIVVLIKKNSYVTAQTKFSAQVLNLLKISLHYKPAITICGLRCFFVFYLKIAIRVK